MTKINGAEVAAGDSGVAEFRQLAPDVWLPASVIGVSYDFDLLREGKPLPWMTRTLRLERAVPHPEHGPERFQVELPDGIPVYTIDSKRRLVDGPHHPHPATENRSGWGCRKATGIFRSRRSNGKSCSLRHKNVRGRVGTNKGYCLGSAKARRRSRPHGWNRWCCIPIPPPADLADVRFYQSRRTMSSNLPHGWWPALTTTPEMARLDVWRTQRPQQWTRRRACTPITRSSRQRSRRVVPSTKMRRRRRSWNVKTPFARCS